MKLQPYDFCKPERMLSSEEHLASDMEQSLARWLRNMCSLAPKKWARQLPFSLTMQLKGLDVLLASDALAALSETAVGYRVPLHAADGRTTLLAFPRPLLLSLTAGMLGETPAELPADRDLSAVEESLGEYLVHDWLLPTLQETWLGTEALPLGTLQKDPNPRWTRIFLPDETLIRSCFSLEGPFGEQEWHWLILQSDLLALFSMAGRGSLRRGIRETAQDIRPCLEALVREMRVDLTVLLGTVELPLSWLGNLRPGDVVILDQRVTDPLVACIAGTRKFLGWPGRIGSRQAVQIEATLES